jgi:predicted glycosyltransferase
MKLIFELGHPAHCHLFRHTIRHLMERGHEIRIIARDKEMLLNLLRIYDLPYISLSRPGKNLGGLALEIIKNDYHLLQLCRKDRPDLLMGISESITHIGRLLGIPSITFTDTEHASLSHLLMTPFADVVCTPSCFGKNFGSHHIRYKGYHELAYLHPNRFTPDPSILDEAGLAKDEPFMIMRFVSWKASHDLGHTGISDHAGLARQMEDYGRVIITSEKPLSPTLEKYRVPVPVEKIHDLMYYATLLYGESATMASECAVLGTHAIFCDFAGRGYTEEEERLYGLVYNFRLDEKSKQRSRNKAVELMLRPTLREEGRQKRSALLREKIDVTAFFLWFIEHYPDSFTLMRESPEIQDRFR